MLRERSGPLDHDGVVTLIDLLMSPSPARHVGIVLREYRKRDWDFEQAWAQAMRTLPRSMPDIDDCARRSTRRKSWRDADGQPQARESDSLVLT